MAHNNFLPDLKWGEAGEKWLSELGQQVTMEVKRCRKALTTGNLFIEISCSGKPSGIMSTEAEYFAYILTKEDMNIACYVWHTTSMRKAIQDSLEAKRYRTVSGGDGNRVVGVLVPLTNIGELTKLCITQA
jgi:hypothetical protein